MQFSSHLQGFFYPSVISQAYLHSCSKDFSLENDRSIGKFAIMLRASPQAAFQLAVTRM
jgi:hypothetical protein